jgi:hypothetical protein
MLEGASSKVNVYKEKKILRTPRPASRHGTKQQAMPK